MFKDHFSGHASDYRRHRPSYPKALFDFLASQANEKKCVWDCATGNGQAAVMLANDFEQVIATDASAEQIAQAEARDNIQYAVAPAENSGLDDHSVDLVTVAQALHWFDHDAFFKECHRVLKPGGLFATWWYRLVHLKKHSDAGKAILREFYKEIVGPHWPKERQHIDRDYQTIEFPFTPVDAPQFSIDLDWNLEQFLNYLKTWSGTKTYIQKFGEDPVERWFKPRILAVYSSLDAPCPVSFPTPLKVGRYEP